MRAIERPRWEDYNYEYLDGSKNRFHWLGDGFTHNEKHMKGNRTSPISVILLAASDDTSYLQVRGTLTIARSIFHQVCCTPHPSDLSAYMLPSASAPMMILNVFQEARCMLGCSLPYFMRM